MTVFRNVNVLYIRPTGTIPNYRSVIMLTKTAEKTQNVSGANYTRRPWFALYIGPPPFSHQPRSQTTHEVTQHILCSPVFVSMIELVYIFLTGCDVTPSRLFLAHFLFPQSVSDHLRRLAQLI